MNRSALLAALVVAIFAFSTPAFADPPNHHNTTGDTITAPCSGTNVDCGQHFDDNSSVIKDNFSPTATAAGGAGGDANSRANGFGLGVGVGGDSSARANGGDARASGGDAQQAQGIFGSGNSDNTNRNLNNSDFGNSASLAGAGVFDSGNSQVGDVGNNSGNSSSDSSASAFGAQGQMQGQVGIQGQLGILDNTNDIDNGNDIDTATSTSTSTSTNSKNKQGQDQTSVGSVDSHDELTVEGDDIVYEAPDIPVNSAAPVFAGACSQGVSVQTQSFGGSAGTTNPVCDYVAVAGGFIAAGDREDALRVLVKAEDAADWRYRFSQIRSVLTLGLL